MENIDVAKQKSSYPAAIQRVGLENVELPVNVQWGGEVQKVMAQADVLVSLKDPLLRGIHMSRLYLALYHFSKTKNLNQTTIKELIKTCVESQKEISDGGRIHIKWKSSIQKKALKSAHTGVQVYSCFYTADAEENPTTDPVVTLGARVIYSSTCPCSASLARSLIQNQFKKEGKNLSYEEVIEWLGRQSSIAGTPHAQRSTADFKIRSDKDLCLPSLIEGVEKALATPVQGAVKREDEQQFARLNSQNLMYSEDAVRKIKAYFESQEDIKDYHIKVRHLESLHPFDTSAVIHKNKTWID